jgi:hypothetical protein
VCLFKKHLVTNALKRSYYTYERANGTMVNVIDIKASARAKRQAKKKDKQDAATTASNGLNEDEDPDEEEDVTMEEDRSAAVVQEQSLDQQSLVPSKRKAQEHMAVDVDATEELVKQAKLDV